MVDHGSNSPLRDPASPSNRARQRASLDVGSGDGASGPNVAKVPALLKAFVIAGGVAMVIGVILLAIMIVLRAGDRGDHAVTDDIPSPAPVVDLAMPEGARIEQVVADGRRLVLLAEDANGQQYLLVVDAESGARQSLIRIKPETAAE